MDNGFIAKCTECNFSSSVVFHVEIHNKITNHVVKYVPIISS